MSLYFVNMVQEQPEAVCKGYVNLIFIVVKPSGGCSHMTESMCNCKMDEKLLDKSDNANQPCSVQFLFVSRLLQ